jgi:hypothetical protein
MVSVFRPIGKHPDQLVRFFVLSDHHHIPYVSLYAFPVFHQEHIVEELKRKNGNAHKNKVLTQGKSTNIGLFKKAYKRIKDQKKENKLGKEQFYDVGDLGIAVYLIKLVFKGDDDPYYGNI